MTIELPFLWATDIHLDFVGPFGWEGFTSNINASPLPALVITGDITNASRLDEDLDRLVFPHKQTYFVLGNHDYFGGDLAESIARATARVEPIYLPKLPYVEVTPKTYLVGVDGYADGRAGNFLRSSVWLNDYHLIRHFAECGTREHVWARLKALGEMSAHELHQKVAGVPLDADVIYIATHVPPFVEANWFDDKPSKPDFLPHFTNVALGDAIRAVAAQRPTTHFVVLCGHVHWGTLAHITPNIECYVGWAKYKYPVVQDLTTIPLRWPR